VSEPGLQARRATTSDTELVTAIITAAFASDPLWSGAMARDDGRKDHHSAFWRLFSEGALQYPWTWVTSAGEVTSLWIPPGQAEMSPEKEGRLIELAGERLGAGAERYVTLLERFAAAHPRGEPHYYLTLLGTHPAHRGRGLGMALLAHDLALIDGEHMPAYLESSNPVNDRRYAQVGFEPAGEIIAPGGELTVTTMWRPAR
jgi:GNAT superfamily N-acetyltransferase